MGSNYSAKYNVDIVMCIDATASMVPLLKLVKANALSFYQDFINEMSKKDKRPNQVRVRVIAFRDYLADGKDAMLLSPFFNLPEQSAEFEQLAETTPRTAWRPWAMPSAPNGTGPRASSTAT